MQKKDDLVLKTQPKNQKSTNVTPICMAMICSFMLFACPASADTELKLERGKTFESGGVREARSAGIYDGALFLVGSNHSKNEKGYAESYALPSSGTKLWDMSWFDAKSPDKLTVLTGVSQTSEGMYFSGLDWSRSREDKTRKQSSGFLLKFPADGPAASGNQPLWAIPSNIYPHTKDEAFLDVVALEGEVGTGVYVAGRASNSYENGSAILAKFDTGGTLEWTRMLTDPKKRMKGAAVELVFYNNYLYVLGYFGKGNKKTDFADIAVKPKLWKFDLEGNEIWAKDIKSVLHNHDRKKDKRFMSLTAADGHIYIALGIKGKKGLGSDTRVEKYTESGKRVWSMKHGNKSGAAEWYGAPGGIAVGPERVYVAGGTESGAKDIFLLEIEPEYGTMMAQHEFDAGGADTVAGVYTAAKKVYILGASEAGNGKKGKGALKSNFVMLKYAPRDTVSVDIDVVPEDDKNEISLTGIGDAKLRKKMRVEVAIFSTSKLDALNDINVKSLTFGRKGTEKSYAGCKKKDLNKDGKKDLLCKFKMLWKAPVGQRQIVKLGDGRAILRGQMTSGERIKADAIIRVDRGKAKIVLTPEPLPETKAAENPETEEISETESIIQSTTKLLSTSTNTSTSSFVGSLSPEPIAEEVAEESIKEAADNAVDILVKELEQVLKETEESILSLGETVKEAPIVLTQAEAELVKEEEGPALTSSPEPEEQEVTVIVEEVVVKEVEPEPIIETEADTTFINFEEAETPKETEQAVEDKIADETKTETTTIEPIQNDVIAGTTEETAYEPTAAPSIDSTTTNTFSLATDPVKLEPTGDELFKSEPPPPEPISEPTKTSTYEPVASPLVSFSGTTTSSGSSGTSAFSGGSASGGSTSSGPLISSGELALNNNARRKLLDRYQNTPSHKNLESKPTERRQADRREQQGNDGTGLAEAYHDLGKDLLKQGNLEEAVIHFKEALKHNPNSKDTHYGLALVMIEEGNVAEARKYLEKTLELDPNFSLAQQSLEQLMQGSASVI